MSCDIPWAHLHIVSIFPSIEPLITDEVFLQTSPLFLCGRIFHILHCRPTICVSKPCCCGGTNRPPLYRRHLQAFSNIEFMAVMLWDGRSRCLPRQHTLDEFYVPLSGTTVED